MAGAGQALCPGPGLHDPHRLVRAGRLGLGQGDRNADLILRVLRSLSAEADLAPVEVLHQLTGAQAGSKGIRVVMHPLVEPVPDPALPGIGKALVELACLSGDELIHFTDHDRDRPGPLENQAQRRPPFLRGATDVLGELGHLVLGGFILRREPGGNGYAEQPLQTLKARARLVLQQRRGDGMDLYETVGRRDRPCLRSADLVQSWRFVQKERTQGMQDSAILQGALRPELINGPEHRPRQRRRQGDAVQSRHWTGIVPLGILSRRRIHRGTVQLGSTGRNVRDSDLTILR